MRAADAHPQVLERRRATRYRVSLPLELEGGSAITRDLSFSGVYFEGGRRLRPGAALTFRLVFSRDHTRLHCEGRVVRVEVLDGRFGGAATIESCWFERGG